MRFPFTDAQKAFVRFFADEERTRLQRAPEQRVSPLAFVEMAWLGRRPLARLRPLVSSLPPLPQERGDMIRRLHALAGMEFPRHRSTVVLDQRGGRVLLASRAPALIAHAMWSLSLEHLFFEDLGAARLSALVGRSGPPSPDAGPAAAEAWAERTLGHNGSEVYAAAFDHGSVPVHRAIHGRMDEAGIDAMFRRREEAPRAFIRKDLLARMVKAYVGPGAGGLRTDMAFRPDAILVESHTRLAGWLGPRWFGTDGTAGAVVDGKPVIGGRGPEWGARMRAIITGEGAALGAADMRIERHVLGVAADIAPEEEASGPAMRH